MLHGKTPWIGLVALVAMFVLPYLPNWLFDGPRTIKHRPRRHVCADCGAAWKGGHQCAIEELTERPTAQETLHGDLRRTDQGPAELVVRPRPRRLSEPDY